MRKTLISSRILTGQIETITATELRAAPGDILLQAQMGKTFNITRKGVVIAVLSRPVVSPTVQRAEPNALELGSEIRRLKLAGS